MWIWPLALLAATAATAWWVSRRFERRIRAARDRVRTASPPTVRRPGLPPLLRTFLDRAIPQGPPRCWTRIEQRGEMRLRPGGPWLPFTAEQIYAVGQPAFVWSARFRLFRVMDVLVDGAGRLEARLLGVVPVARAEGPAAAQAQLARYLAEIVWVPAAVAGNPALSWKQIGEREVVGTAALGGVSSALTFTFDADGDLARVAGERQRQVGDTSERTPWVGTFSDYRELGGARVPVRGEVRWLIGDDPFPYWRGTITSWSAGS